MEILIMIDNKKILDKEIKQKDILLYVCKNFLIIALMIVLESPNINAFKGINSTAKLLEVLKWK